jgi:hypothetical protein
MNYDHLNKVHDYWVKDVFPHLSHHMAITSFDDYLKQMSLLPSGKWLKDFDGVKVLRVPFVVDPVEFIKAYKPNCVAYCCPSDPKDGIHRVIYQLSPKLHVEAAFWAWVEEEKVQSYISMFVCFNDDKELSKFFKQLESMKREGNTEERDKTGFAGLMRND